MSETINTTNGQAVQEQGAGQIPCTKDTEKIIQKFPNNMNDIAFNEEDSVNENYLKLITTVTSDYVNGIDRCCCYRPKIMSELRKKTIDAFKAFNKEADKRGVQRLNVPKKLNAYQIARLFMALNHVLLIPEIRPGRLSVMPSRSGYDVVVYQNGCYYGVNVELEYLLTQSLHRRFDLINDFRLIKDIRFWLSVLAEKAEPYHGQELIPVLNGIFNCQTKQLMAYSPKYVFLEKEPVYCQDGRNGLVMHHYDGREESVDDWLKRIRESSGGSN